MAKRYRKPIPKTQKEIANDLINPYNEYANNYSLNFSSAIDLFMYLKQSNISDYILPNIDVLANKSIHNWRRTNFNSTDEIISIFDDMNVIKQKIYTQGIISSLDIKVNLFYFLKKNETIRKFVNFLFKNKIEKFMKGREVLNLKFPDLNMKLVENIIKDLNDLDDKTSLLKELIIEKISPKTLLIYKKM